MGGNALTVPPPITYNRLMTDIPEKNWFVLATKPKQEVIAEQNLRKQGIEVYLPLYRRQIKVKRERVEVITPLFPGYLFARFDLAPLYSSVRYTRGVKTILGNGDRVWTLDDDKIASIRLREIDGVVVLKPRNQVFSPGETVRIDQGAFDGWEGVFQEELPDQKRALILLTNLHYSSKMIVPKSYLSHP